MADPTITQIRKAAAKRREAINSSEKRLRAALKRLQFKINAFVTRELIGGLEVDDDGKISKDKNNRNKLRAAGRLRNVANVNVYNTMNSLFSSEFAKIKKANDKYYKLFKPTKKQKKEVDKIHKRLILAFRRNILVSLNINNKISSKLNAGIRKGDDIEQFSEEMRTFIEGKDKLGVIEHAFWEKEGFEEFQVQANAVSEAYSKRIKLDYAIYAGGEILTTREFCDHRNGNVYTRDEIKGWEDEDWQGKKKNHNIFIDVGGYNCRHNYDWISYQLAVRLRPDLNNTK
jgi:sugar-specific transcriptional regulator TrmB